MAVILVRLIPAVSFQLITDEIATEAVNVERVFLLCNAAEKWSF